MYHGQGGEQPHTGMSSQQPDVRILLGACCKFFFDGANASADLPPRRLRVPHPCRSCKLSERSKHAAMASISLGELQVIPSECRLEATLHLCGKSAQNTGSASFPRLFALGKEVEGRG